MNFGIIGVGRFGTNYLRTLCELNASVKWVCSRSMKSIDSALQKCNPGQEIKKTTDYKIMLNDRSVDAVIVSSPGSTHYKIAKDSLNAGKHALVEKPMCLSSREAEDLSKTAKKNNKVVMAGHLHLFNPGIQKLREDIKRGLFGRINYISIFHSGNGPIRTDISALWDFFPHSVSILLYLLEANPVELSVNGASFIKKGNEDIVTMDMKFPNNVSAVSIGTWLYPLKKMDIIIAGENLYAVFDDYAIDKLRYFDSRPRIVNGKIMIDDKGYKGIPIGDSKPLTEQVKYFLNLIKTKNDPQNNLKSGLRVTKILELAQNSLKTGAAIKINKL
ncbi:Gfo/Idh/MocA family oxidoreductase [Candidatus Woesearchaeota archaeon]|nr:Gfo/Idh/MocA family oxidoreductase [Candidatus Woesearchaeota archaeon]